MTHDILARSPNAEALRAEIHRDHLLSEAATSRLARAAIRDGVASDHAATSLISRVRHSLARIGRPVRHDYPECA